MASNGTFKITLFDFLDAILASIIIVQGGIGAVDFAEPWNIIAPMAVAAGAAFLTRLVKKGGESTIADREATISNQREQIAGLISENTTLKSAPPPPDPPAEEQPTRKR